MPIKIYLQLIVNWKRDLRGILPRPNVVYYETMTKWILHLSLFAVFLGAANAQVDVLTANYDNNRTNANLNEAALNTIDVNSTQFGKLYSIPVDGQVYAQPLYVHALSMPGKGTLNVLFVATMHNSVYAFDADAAGGTPLWHVNLGTPVDPLTILYSGGGSYSDIQHAIGILGTPVIDRSAGVIYLVTETIQSGATAFSLHALDLTTGGEKLNGPTEIQATVTGNGWGGTTDPHTGQLPFDPGGHIQRPGLLLANGNIYIAFGSHGDFPPWHGWIMAYNASDIRQQTAVFCTTPSGAGVAIWQGGRGLVADPDGEVYTSTGNGSYDGATNWGESVLHLNSKNLEVADWFTPSQYPDWTDDDADFGSNGPILIPGTNMLIAGGKAGLVALMDRTNMGHELAGNTQALQTFAAVPEGKFAIYNTALWNRPDGPLLYIWGYHDVLRAFQMQNGIFNTTPQATNGSMQQVYPFGGMTVSSNGFSGGSGIFWVTSETGGAFPTPGTLHALDAMDVSHELWNSDINNARDAMGNYTKFANPTVVNGKVYMPTDSQQITVYGLLPVPGIRAVVSAASFTSSTVAPGELISIFGSGIGPTPAQQLTLSADGKVTTSLGGVTVSFDGVAAPLLYAGASQINAVVPFSVAGKTTTVLQVNAPGNQTFSVSVPVSSVAPAAFSMTATGSGQGAVLNSDLSVNSASHPATRGSAISIYATGMGTIRPAVPDGTLIPSDTLPVSEAPISVTIGGQAAKVTYQGGAPGLVAGVTQVNAEIPTGITPGSAVAVVVSAGGVAGLNTVTVAVQ